MKGLSSKHIALKVDGLKDGKYTVFRRVRASFNTETLEAGADNGLRGRLYMYMTYRCIVITITLTPALRWEAIRAVLMFH